MNTEQKVKQNKVRTLNAIKKHFKKHGITYYQVQSDELNPYCDFIIEEDGILKKVKTQISWIENGSVNFWSTPSSHEKVDLIYVYLPKWERIYRVPSPIAVSTGGTLRFMPIFKRKPYAFAKDYEA
jgi:hypothetical protein